jgi:hypothetical protein
MSTGCQNLLILALVCPDEDLKCHVCLFPVIEKIKTGTILGLRKSYIETTIKTTESNSNTFRPKVIHLDARGIFQDSCQPHSHQGVY